MRCKTPLHPLLVVFLLIAACSASDDSGADSASETGPTTIQAPPSTAATSTEVATPLGSEERTVLIGDDSRSYLLYMPSTLDPTDPAPLVVSLHGLTESARTQEGRRFNETAEREGIVVAYPDAVSGAWDQAGTSDIEFIAEIIDEVSSLTAIDQNQVYAMGYSQGGAFSTFLACHLPAQITAVASVAALLHHDAPACPTHSPARVLTFVGEADSIYSIEEGLTISSPDPDPPGPLAEESGDWAATNGCNREPDEELLPEGVVRYDYGCAEGAALEVYVHPGGHIWPVGVYELDANEMIWEFFEQYTAPLPAE